MKNGKMIAIVGLGAVLPDAFDVASFWNNILNSKYSVTDVPADRWSVDLYYDPDHTAEDKTYSKIGAFVKGYTFDPLKNGLIIPPKLLSEMDLTQQWAIAVSQQALKDYGYPERKLDPERMAVIFGNANAGEFHYRSTFRILLPEYLQALKTLPDFESLPESVKENLLQGVTQNIHAKTRPITEDTMPGELSNIIAGRVANVFNFTGPNFVTDAACASSLAAIQAACQGLLEEKFDAVLTGGIDRHMGPESYIKFSKIGALSAEGSRPYADGANGFVMGEGAAVFLMKRLEDAERDGDKIYAVIRGIGGSSDGKGKGITAPNPNGQQFALRRAWLDAQVDPQQVGLIEGHGTSTKVGDVAEVTSLNAVFGSLGIQKNSVVLGSVKSNIGHLKGAAGAVGLLKTVLSLYNKTLPPTVNFDRPNPNIDFANLPFRVITGPQEWQVREGNFRFAGVSAFGFGGTNFHVVLEEYFPGVAGNTANSYLMPARMESMNHTTISQEAPQSFPIATSQGSLAVNQDEVTNFVLSVVSEKTGYPTEMLEMDLDLEADLGIDTVKQAELFATVRTNYGIPRREDLKLSDYSTLAKVVGFVTDALGKGEGKQKSDPQNGQIPQTVTSVVEPNQQQSNALTPYQGLYFASAKDLSGLKAKIESQLAEIRSGAKFNSHCPTPEELAEVERLAIDYASDEELVKRLEKTLSAFENDTPATWKAMQAHGVYRGSGTPGKVAFLFPGQGSQYVNMLLDLRDTEPLVRDTFDEADRVMTPILGRPLTSFIYTNGSDEELKQAEQELKNTAITQPAMLTANVAVMRVLNKYGVYPDMVIGHSLGEYAALVSAGVLTFAEALEVVSARGREMSKIKVDDPGCMAAVSAPLEKVEEVIKSVDGYVVIANINSPLQSVLGGSTEAIDAAIAKFVADGFQAVKIPVSHAFHTRIVAPASEPLRSVIARMNVQSPRLPIVANVTGELYPADREAILDLLASQVASPVQFVKGMQTLYREGVRVFIESGPKRVLNALAQDNLKDQSDVTIIATNHPRKGGKASFNEALCGIYAAGVPAAKQNQVAPSVSQTAQQTSQVFENAPQPVLQDGMLPITGSVVISGAGLGLPGVGTHVFGDDNIERILKGEMRIEPIGSETRQAILDKHITRLVKSEAGAVMEEITDLDQVIKLAGQGGEFDLEAEFGVPADRVDSLDISSKLAIAAGVEALRDAGIPLVMSYRKTTTGSYLPDRWKLPESMRDDTGIIFGSAFPGLNRVVEEADRFYEAKILEKQLEEVRSLLAAAQNSKTAVDASFLDEMRKRAGAIEAKIKEVNYQFDRRYIFRILSMGHSQFAEYIGARGPNTHVNAACATTTHAVSIAEDWIRTGRCRRVVVIAGDDVTKENSLAWIGSSLFASGAATTEGNLRLAAIPFDKRRNGMIIGMGAAALVIESEDAARERGVRGIGEILSTNIGNSAYHGTRLDVNHVSDVMDRLLKTAERRFGIDRQAIAHETVFMSHETYTPARGGSASAEIRALRKCFGADANRVIVANTKGFTGHSMGVGIEDVVVTKALETGIVPPIAHIQEGFEPDPELGDLNLSKGGTYNPQYALRLGAGFGSQVAMTLVRRIPGSGERINREVYNKWLSAVCGYEQAETELDHRTLRIKDQGVPTRDPMTSTWSYGKLPTLWAMGDEAATSSIPVLNVTSVKSERVTTEEKPQTQVSTATVMAASNPGNEAIKPHVLSEVSEKTGYPVEMLDLDLDLEADLGIDTVKQAELFAAIRTHYGIPRREDLILANYNTLAKVIGFVEENLGAQPQAAATEPVAEVKTAMTQQEEANHPAGVDTEAIKQVVLSLASEKTGYPVEMLDLDLDLEADLGIDTVKQAELFASVRTNYGIPRREDLILANYNTLAKVIGFVEEALASAPAQQGNDSAESIKEGRIEESKDTSEPSSELAFRSPTLVLLPKTDLCQTTQVNLVGREVLIVAESAKVATPLGKKLRSLQANPLTVKPASAADKVAQLAKAGTLAGVYYLNGLEEFDWKSSTNETWLNERKALLVPLFELAKLLPESAFLMCASAMGGALGFFHTENPQAGLISGFAKALKRERPNQLIKLIDVVSSAKGVEIAEILVNETLHDPVTTEIGYEGDSRYSVKLTDVSQDFGEGETSLKGNAFVVSGATGGITTSVLLDLAKASQGSFYLLARTQLPTKEDADLQMLRTDRNALRLELQRRAQEKGGKVTPVQLDLQIQVLERADAMLKTLDEMRAVGASVQYIVCDVTNPKSVEEAINEIKKSTDHIDRFIHAAGVEKSRKIESKSAEEFEQTISVKADGFYLLFKAFEKEGLTPSSMVFFSSVAGRFGNSGQTDYSAANDMLSKFAFALQMQYPTLKAVSIDWGAWAEVGMASRGNIPMLMERAGIEMLRPAAAAPMVRKAMEAVLNGEFVVAGYLGVLNPSCQDNCGVDVEAANKALRSGTPIHKMFSNVTSFSVEDGIRLEAELDPAQELYLNDHRINGIPVLPGVMGIEGFSVAAKYIASVLGSKKSTFEVDRLENVQFLTPFKFYGDKPRTIQWNALAERTEDGVRVNASLESDIVRRNGEIEHSVHFTGTVYLSTQIQEKELVVKPPKWNAKEFVSAEDIYRLYFHGPSFQVLESAQLSNGKVLGKFNKNKVALAADDPSLFATPLLIEMCFQTAGLFEAGATGTLALPQSLGTLRLFNRPLNGVAIYAEVNPRLEGNSYCFDARVVDAKGNVFLELTDYRTSAMPYPAEEQLVAPLKKLISS